jgi:hypothetical protein
MSAILRHRHPNRFTVLPNDAIRNPSLSFRAVGVLAHLLSLPDGAKVDSATLAGAHKEGRDAVRSAFGELAEHGFYRRDVVRLSDGTLRTEVVVSSTPMDHGEVNGAGRTEDGFSGVGPGPENPAPVNPTSAEPAPVDQASKEEVPTTEEPFPPQPPRRAGGREVSTPKASRALGTNPRAGADRAEQARLEAEAEARRAALERATEARRAAERAAAQESDRLEAEALAVSAALDDATLAAVVAGVRPAMSGPLAASAMAVARAVVGWCRTAAVSHDGDLAGAVLAGRAAGLAEAEGTAPPLDLPEAPAGTASLRARVTALLKPVEEA